MLDHFERDDHIEALALGHQRLDRLGAVVDRQAHFSRMRAGDRDVLLGRIEPGHRPPMRASGSERSPPPQPTSTTLNPASGRIAFSSSSKCGSPARG